MKKQICFIPFEDKRVGVQVKLCYPLTTRAMPEHFCDEVVDKAALYQVSSTSTTAVIDIGIPHTSSGGAVLVVADRISFVRSRSYCVAAADAEY